MNALPNDPQESSARAARPARVAAHQHAPGWSTARIAWCASRRSPCVSIDQSQAQPVGLRSSSPSSLLLIICYAVWGMLDGYDVTPTGIPDASDQMMILLLWSLPVTAFLLGFVWIRRGRNRANGEVIR